MNIQLTKSGLDGVPAAETVLSHVDGAGGRLIVRGFELGEIAHRSFEAYSKAVVFRGTGASRAAEYGAVAVVIRSVGSASLRGSTIDCAKSGEDGNRLKLTISAPLPLRNCLRETDSVFIPYLLPYTSCPAARLTARRIRICVPQRHRLPARASLIWLSVGLGFLSSRALELMIMPLIQ